MKMNPAEARRHIAEGETLAVEFKSERAKKISDSDIVAVVVCLSNGQGGNLLIGVEDDGTITGAQPRHGAATDPTRLRTLIANNTVPQVIAEVDIVRLGDHDIVRVGVPRAESVIGTRAGLYVRRAIGSDGKPACVPFLAHEMLADRIARGEADYATIPEPHATLDDLEPGEFDRFRRLASAAGTSTYFAELGDEDVLRALELAERRGETLLLRRGALMLFGKEDSMRRFVPTHETAFQVLQRSEIVRSQQATHPLLRSAEELFALLRSQNEQKEVVVGLVRVAIDRVPEVVARELIANALVHRDYTMIGTITVQIRDDELSITSPGGFPRGVTLDNFLESSHPRSRVLASAFNHAGLVDRAGRGINKVFEAALRTGRPQPEYARSTTDRVVVDVELGGTDVDLVRFVIAHDEKSGRPFDMADLQIVRALKDDPRLTAGELAESLQRPLAWTKTRLARQVEDGLIEIRGDGRSRRFTLSAATYRTLASDASYVRIRAFDDPQQSQMIMNFVETHGSISRREAAELCGTSPENARRILLRLRDEGRLAIVGDRRTSRYVLTTG